MTNHDRIQSLNRTYKSVDYMLATAISRTHQAARLATIYPKTSVLQRKLQQAVDRLVEARALYEEDLFILTGHLLRMNVCSHDTCELEKKSITDERGRS